MTDISDVRSKLRDIFMQMFNVEISANLANSHFFGKELNLHARDLIYFLHSTEDHFGIRFSEDDLLCGKLFYLEGIHDLVAQRLGELNEQNFK